MDPDQLASKKPADLDLHCFANRILSGLARYGLVCPICSWEMSEIIFAAISWLSTSITIANT